LTASAAVLAIDLRADGRIGRITAVVGPQNARWAAPGDAERVIGAGVRFVTGRALCRCPWRLHTDGLVAAAVVGGRSGATFTAEVSRADESRATVVRLAAPSTLPRKRVADGFGALAAVVGDGLALVASPVVTIRATAPIAGRAFGVDGAPLASVGVTDG
jgi:hypothetical protein